MSRLRQRLPVPVLTILLLTVPLAAAVPLPDHQNDGEAGRDAGDSPQDAVPVLVDDLFPGDMVPPIDVEDWYAVELTAGDEAQLWLASGSGCMDLLDGAQAVIAHVCDVGSVGTGSERVPIDTTGTYHLRVATDLVERYVAALFVEDSGDGFRSALGERTAITEWLEIAFDAFNDGFEAAADAFDDAVDVAIGLLAYSDDRALPPVSPASQAGHHTVVAVVDTGVNPYHEFLRADGLQDHPSTWLDGFPSDAVPLQLTLDEADLAAAVAADQPLWDQVERSSYDSGRGSFDAHLYTFPGTRVVGAVSFGEFNGLNQNLNAEERPILDDEPHGALAVGLAAGAGLAAADGDVLVVAVEVGSFNDGIRWAIRQPWIDVVSVSASPPANAPVNVDDEIVWEAHARGVPILFASGNGVSGQGGPDRCSTWTSPWTGPQPAFRIGAANGAVEDPMVYHCVPVDALGRTNVPSTASDRTTGRAQFGGTSAATPNVAGHAAQLLLDARRAGIDATPREAIQHLLNASLPSDPDVSVFLTSPSNPVTQPVDQGFGVVNGDALDRARATLLGGHPPTPRPELDDWFEFDRAVRAELWPAPPEEDDSPAPEETGLLADDDAGSGRDAPDRRAQGLWIDPGVVYDGFMESPFDDADMYRFNVTAGQQVDMAISGLEVCADLILPDGSDTDQSCSTTGTRAGQGRAVLEDGVWVLRVTPHTTTRNPSSYQFSIGLDAPAPSRNDGSADVLAQDDAGSGDDAPTSAAGAPWVEPGSVYEGRLEVVGLDDRDWYRWNGTAGQELHVLFGGDGTCLDIHSPDGVERTGVCVLARPATDAIVALAEMGLPGYDILYEAFGDLLREPDLRMTLDMTGVWAFKLASDHRPDQYQFSFGLDEDAPELPERAPGVVTFATG